MTLLIANDNVRLFYYQRIDVTHIICYSFNYIITSWAEDIIRMSLSTIYLVPAIVIYFITCPICMMAAEKQHIQDDSLFDKQIFTTESSQINCYNSAKYLVIAKEVQGSTGTDFLIKYKSNPREKLICNYVPGTGNFEIKNEWAEYFAGLKNDLLILDSTTGPGPSGLVIWDLAKRKKVYEGSWSDPEASKNDSLVYWLETGEATPANCPELENWKSQGLEAAIETKVILNLSNFRISKTQQTRCSPRQ
jgi:hypothetical protein